MVGMDIFSRILNSFSVPQIYIVMNNITFLVLIQIGIIAKWHQILLVPHCEVNFITFCKKHFTIYIFYTPVVLLDELTAECVEVVL